MPLNLNRLNSRQREAVLHSEGPLLILAGAGSGKTSTMAYRIAHLVTERHLPARAILGLSFTNKAARELKERVIKLISEATGKSGRPAQGQRGPHGGLTISTFHSLCVRLLRAHAEVLGFQKNFTIIDRNDQIDILKQLFKNINIDDRKFDLDSILFEYGQAKNRFLSVEEAEAQFLENARLVGAYQDAAASCYRHYQNQLRLLNAMDFDDLIYHGVRLLETSSEVRELYNKQFRHILVDEYQDTNPAQFRLLRLLTERQQNLCVVGDDDQSIYAWRGADPTHILEFPRHFPSAKTIILDQNYRSTNTILEAANQVIANNKTRHTKKLWSERGNGDLVMEVILEEDRAEAEFVADELEARAKREQRPWKDFAILYRSNTQSRVFEEALRRRRIPYKIVGGLSFLERKEVKDAVAAWRLIVNPSDDASTRRILTSQAKGLGRTSLEALNNHAFQNKVSLFEALARTPEVAPRSAEAAARFRGLIQGLQAKLAATPADPIALVEWARFSFEQLGFKQMIEADSDDPVQAARKWENVEELIHSIGQIRLTDFAGDSAPPASGTELLREFLSRLVLEAQEETEEEDSSDSNEQKNQVTLLTLHGAKGLEFPVVFLVGIEEGLLPHRRSIEENADLSEERRLCYVGITRARDLLLITRAKNRVRYGKPVPRYRSRFLNEIAANLIAVQDQSLTGPDESSKEIREQHEVRVKSFLDEIRSKLAQPRSR